MSSQFIKNLEGTLATVMCWIHRPIKTSHKNLIVIVWNIHHSLRDGSSLPLGICHLNYILKTSIGDKWYMSYVGLLLKGEFQPQNRFKWHLMKENYAIKEVTGIYTSFA